MALPTLFANLSVGTGAELDANFAAVGAIGVIPCAAAGTNAITLTPAANTPTVSAYANYAIFSFIAAGTNTTVATASVGSLAALPIYKDTLSGPLVLSGGEIVAGNAVSLTYDSALAGFHVRAVVAATQVFISGTPTAGQIAAWANANTVQGQATTGTGNVVLATGATLAPATLLGTGSYTVATLPTPAAGIKGQRTFVTDATLASYAVGIAAAATGGGSHFLPVFCDGTAWYYG